MEDSCLTFTEETVMEDMKLYVCNISHSKCSETIGMEFDDLVSELNIEIIKGVRYYATKKLNFGQIKSILRRMIDNRVNELLTRHYYTYRKAYENSMSIDLNVEIRVTGTIAGMSISELGNPIREVESKDRVEMTRSRLSEQAKLLFDAIVYNDTFLITLQMLNLDKKFRYNKVAAALGIPEREVKSAFVEIRNAYAEVLNV
jgi:hypothetical protein